MVQMGIYFLEVINIYFEKYIKEIIGTKKDEVLFEFQKKFVNIEKKKKNILIWNSFIETPRCYSFEEIFNINIPDNKELNFFLERQNKLYVTTLQSIIDFIDNFESWDEIDAYIFDETMIWVVAITHEDNLLLVLGL